MAPKKNYTPSDMAHALELIANGKPVAAVSRETGIPRTTLIYKSSGKSPAVCGMGPPTILTAQEETFLVQWIMLIQQRHFPITKTMLLDSVEKIIKKTKRQNPFKNNRPGDKWFKSFLRRHPELSSRVAQNLTPARENVTEKQIRHWFDEVREYLNSSNLFDITNEPKRVFNADESAFYLNPKGSKVLARKGDKNIYSVGGDEKDNLTVLLTANAAGQVAPPMILFTYSRVPTHIAMSIPSSWGIGNSESGWMCSATFYEYIANIFVPWLDKEKIERPILLFIDGHKSHLTLHLSNFCMDNGIELVALFPNSTHLLQPMDVAVFRPLKNAWKNEIQKWRSANGGIKVLKQNFGALFGKALEHVTETTVKNGFRVSGICPFNVENVKFEKLSEYHSLTPAPSTNNNSLNICLKELETRIPSDTLVLFESQLSESTWQGETENTSLFNLWKAIRQEVEESKGYMSQNNTMEDNADGFVDTNNKNEEQKTTSPTASFENYNIENERTPPTNDNIKESGNREKIPNLPTPLQNVPTPFRKALFWPEPTTSTKRKLFREKIPSVVTSLAWREYNIKKENEKKRKIEEKEQRKLEREQKKLQNIQTKKSKKKIMEESETSDDEEPEDNGNTSSDVDPFEISQDFCDLECDSSISTGDYVLVRFLGGKRNTTHYRYACVVQKVFDDGDIEVMSMKILNEDKTIFKMNETDISNVNKEDVLGKLPSPTMLTYGDRIKYKFDKPVDVFEAS